MCPSKKPLFIEDVVEPAPIRSRTFAKAFPEAAARWCYERNCGFAPEDFSYGSSVHAWFKCPEGPDHFYQITLSHMGIAVRTDTWSMGCGFCRGMKISVDNNLVKKYPQLAREFMTRKNGFRPSQVSYGSGKMVWWKCKRGHEWQARVANRTSNDSGCPRCNHGAPTDLRDYPDVLKEFDRKKNKGIDPHALPVGLKVAWVCSKISKHRWVSGFYRTEKRIRCPYCTNQKASDDNNLKKTHPYLAAEWDARKNGDLKPNDVTPGSQLRVFWKCKKGPDHEWHVRVVDRVRDKTGCPFCSFRKTSVTNVISTVAPQIAKEWHPSKNGKARPDEERIHSRTKRFWLCTICRHEWMAEPHRRIERGHGCPECASKSSK